jgi:outer membrane protein
MLKKIALLAVIAALPLGAMAQKFAHMNSTEIIMAMPEYTKVMTDMETMQKQYRDEIQRSQEELNRKFMELQQQLDSLPKNIAERRQKELNDIAVRNEQFQQDADQNLQKSYQEAMTPVQKKLNDAIQAVGKAEGVIYIFDMGGASRPILYVGAESIDLTPKIKAQLGIK